MIYVRLEIQHRNRHYSGECDSFVPAGCAIVSPITERDHKQCARAGATECCENDFKWRID